MADFARGVQMLDDGLTPAAALPLVSAAALAKSDLAVYSRYFSGVALMRLDRLDEADAAFAHVIERNPIGQLPESALYRRAEIRQTRSDFAGAASIYQQLLERTSASPQIALVRLGVMASEAKDPARAIDAYRRVLREHPLSSEAAEAEKLLESLGGFVFETPAAISAELGRAEALFKARRGDQARAAFNRVRDLLQGDERDLADFRLAQIDANRGQHRIAREIFRRFTAHPQLAVEAQYAIVSSTRILGEEDEFKQLTNDFVARNPNHRLAEEALNRGSAERTRPALCGCR
jgi:tetratricopeptide (TPR) repeat protein